MDRQTEYAEKRTRIAAFMAAHKLEGLALGRAASWSWASCGGEANVALNSEHAEATLLFTQGRDYLLANRIELPRLLAEELGDLPIEPVELPWHEPARRAALVTELAGGPLGSDTPTLPDAILLAPAIAALRYRLCAAEQARLRILGAAAGAAIEAATRAVAPGMSEQEVAGLLAAESFRRGVTPVVLLVAADERSARFRHPWPTERRIKRTAMLVLCARRQGLIVSATRLVHFGPLPVELRQRAEACAQIDATVMLATRPGRCLNAIFTELQAAYAGTGFADEWLDHHQGGLAGYENREALAMPEARLVVQVGQAYAWNPSIAGVKSEDTMLVGADGPELLTATGDWPQLVVEVGEQRMWRPAILVR